MLREDHCMVTGGLGEGAGSNQLSQKGKLDVCCLRNEKPSAGTLLQPKEDVNLR